MHDAFDLLYTTSINCLDHGHVKLLDVMPRLIEPGKTCDSAIVDMARVSYNSNKAVQSDRSLIRYLLRHRHTSPFEAVEFKFHIKLPLFVQGQLVRHRTASLNQISARYSVMPEEFYIPEEYRMQSKNNKQGGDKTAGEVLNGHIKNSINEVTDITYQTYKYLLDFNISREMARFVLPQNVYTAIIWKIDLHNLLHFLNLRCDVHAQLEIREYANAILKLITPLVPDTIEAWNDYSSFRDGVLLTKSEIDALKGNENFKTEREKQEWLEKKPKLQ